MQLKCSVFLSIGGGYLSFHFFDNIHRCYYFEAFSIFSYINIGHKTVVEVLLIHLFTADFSFLVLAKFMNFCLKLVWLSLLFIVGHC